MTRPARHRRNEPARRPAPRRVVGPWKHGRIPVIGLVGGIGAGKSTVAAALAGRGAAVLDADVVGHALLDQTPSREQVVARFGDEVLDASDPSRIDRRRLGRIVFAERESLRALESILHPRMRDTFERAIARFERKRQHEAVVLDAAILFEAGWDDLCDIVAFVEAPRELRQKRVAVSRGWDAATIDARERSQLPLDLKRSRADVVIRNDGDSGSLEADLERLWRQIKLRARSRPSRTRAGSDASAENSST